jgi:hypothetical protein
MPVLRKPMKENGGWPRLGRNDMQVDIVSCDVLVTQFCLFQCASIDCVPVGPGPKRVTNRKMLLIEAEKSIALKVFDGIYLLLRADQIWPTTLLQM